MLNGEMFSRWVFLLASAAVMLSETESLRAEITIQKSRYRSWNEAFVLSNGKVEAVAVPLVGRVMQFRFAGEKDGPFWENTLMDGKAPDSQSSEWRNFGGDKSWPAPQGDWEKLTGRGWPPPAGFDSVPVTAGITGKTLVLRSPIDQHFGIEVERRIQLHADEPQMEIETIYHKKKGDPVRVSVWTITQLKDPEYVVMPLPKKSLFPASSADRAIPVQHR